jgi:transposase InsO family protein
VRYRAIQAYDRRYPIRLMCRALNVSPAGYYAWRTRPESARSVSARTVLSAIRVIHRESRETYGSPRIWNALIKQGHDVGEHRIARLMRQEGIRAKTVKKWRATTQSQHRFPVAANTLNRQFTVESPNRVWAGDLTYVWTNEGWLYLAVILDLYSRLVVGWAMDHRLTVELAEQALTMALVNRNPQAGLLHHSDRGSQYAATRYQRLLGEHGITPSMSRTGNCWDNACGESFFGTLKRELVYHRRYETREAARQISSRILRCSITGDAVTRPSAMTPRPSSKRERQLLNPVSTELGEGQVYFNELELSNNLLQTYQRPLSVS